jgi:hypothetical protein
MVSFFRSSPKHSNYQDPTNSTSASQNTDNAKNELSLNLASQNSKDLLCQESNVLELGFMSLRPSKEEFSCPLKTIMQ